MLYIINGRNNGYPCVPETGELPETNLVQPFPLNAMTISENKNNGYPHIYSLPELPNTNLVQPFPLNAMTISENKNNGYPHIYSLPELPQEAVDSNLMFNSLPVTRMYFGKKLIKIAFCSRKSVYRLGWGSNS